MTMHHKKMMNPSKYFAALKTRFDHEKLTELYSTNEFTLAIAVMLSAQATDKHVNTVTPALFAVASCPEEMLALGETDLKTYIKSISFFNNKAKNIIAMSTKLSLQAAATGGGTTNSNEWRFPLKYHSRDELMKLPGIGQKTANVVSNILWGAENIGVDTHVFRLSHRFGWAEAADNTPEKVEEKLLKLIPRQYQPITNHLMVMHGRYICKAIRPDCTNCPVRTLRSCRPPP